MTRTLPEPIQRLVNSGIIKSSMLVYFGSIANAGLSFLSTVLVARILSPTNFGLFSTAVAALLLFNEITDLGISPGLIRYASFYLGRGELENARTTFRFAIRSRLLFTTLAVGFGLIGASQISRWLGQPPATFRPLLDIAFLGIVPLVIVSFTGAALQSEQRFGAYVSVNMCTGLVRLMSILAVIRFHPTIYAAVLAYACSPLLAAIVGIAVMNRSLLRKTADNPLVVAQVRSFSLWMATWALFASVQGRLDQFMVTRMLGGPAAGQYAAAYQFSSVFIFLVAAIGTVLNPRLASLSHEKLRSAAKMNRLYTVAVAVAALALALGGQVILPLLFGSKYSGALPLFSVLMIGLFFFGLSALPNSLLNALNHPYVFCASAALGLVLTAILNFFFLPHFGLIGVGYTFDIVNGSTFLLSFIAARVLLNRSSA